MSPDGRTPDELEVWRVRDLRDLELRRAEGAAASQRSHVHAEFEIAVVERGVQRVRHRGVSHIAAPGTLIVIPPGDVHAHESPGDDASYRSFFPDLASLHEASGAASNRGTTAFRQTAIDDHALSRHIGELHRLLARPGSLLARETHAVVAASALVSRHATLQPPPSMDRREVGPVQRARAYLHDHLDVNVSLADLVVVAGLPAIALVTAFTRAVGMPPHAYHVQLRVNQAKQMLARGVSPARVAFATGFVDQSHFTRHFKRCVGVTPGHYVAAVI